MSRPPRSPDVSPARRPGSPSRRQLLGSLAAGATAATAGCRVITGPESLSTEVIEQSDRRLAWQFPATEGDADGIGYLSVSRRRVRASDSVPSARFRINATILADDYRHDWFRVRLHAPQQYQQQHGPCSFLVEPPGQWEQFRTFYRYTGAARELVIELRGIETEGTIHFPVVLRAVTGPLPDALRCAFTVQAKESGWLGKTMRADDSGTFTVAPEG